MNNKILLQFPTYSKNILMNQPYYITYNGDAIYMYKCEILQNQRNLKYTLRVKLSATVGWIKTNNILLGFIIHIGNKQKKFYCDDYIILSKFKELLECKVSFYNIFDFYDFKEQIGRGASSKVIRAQIKGTCQQVAIKIIDKSTLKPISFASLEQEIEILRKVKGSIYCSQIIEIFQSEYSYFIVMKMLDGLSLQNYLDNGKIFNEKQILQIMRRILEGINYLHSQGIIHRDIKPENLILIEKDNFDTLTIIDFGLSTFTYLSRYLFYKCGTPGFVAPEILNSQFRDIQSENCDVFSCGCIFYRLITGKNPFKGKTYEEVLLKNKQCQIDFNVKYNEHCNQLAINLLHTMLKRNPEERITAKAALQSSFFYNESLFSINDENWDNCPLVNQLPLLQTMISSVFHNPSIRNLKSQEKLLSPINKRHQFFSPQLSPFRKE